MSSSFSQTPAPACADPQLVFDPFYTTKPVGKGTGLGLSICYGLIHDQGGQISCYNRPEGGATFRIELPAAPSSFPFHPDVLLAKQSGETSLNEAISAGRAIGGAFGYNLGDHAANFHPPRRNSLQPSSRRARLRSKGRYASASPRSRASWLTGCMRGASSIRRTIRSSPISTGKNLARRFGRRCIS